MIYSDLVKARLLFGKAEAGNQSESHQPNTVRQHNKVATGPKYPVTLVPIRFSPCWDIVIDRYGSVVLWHWAKHFMFEWSSTLLDKLNMVEWIIKSCHRISDLEFTVRVILMMAEAHRCEWINNLWKGMDCGRLFRRDRCHRYIVMIGEDHKASTWRWCTFRSLSRRSSDSPHTPQL